MQSLGVGECFFGPPWSWAERANWAEFLGRQGLDFYLYGPKADPFLRKRWREEWPAEYLQNLAALAASCRQQKIGFGFALSPYGVLKAGDAAAKSDFQRKIKALAALKPSDLGIFFDDMHYVAGMLDAQLELLDLARHETDARLLFCPTYYSPDPILDKVFGPRPADYLTCLGQGAHPDVEIFWTGPKVISPEIPAAHLQEVGKILRRKPFLFDNYFANDGPKNCKFLKLKPLAGRAPEALALASGWMFNPMNQSFLSQLVVGASAAVLRQGADPETALQEELEARCEPATARLLWENREVFGSEGVERIPALRQRALAAELAGQDGPAAREVGRWLAGEYGVGADCLTD